jgi:hypothetical protein
LRPLAIEEGFGKSGEVGDGFDGDEFGQNGPIQRRAGCRAGDKAELRSQLQQAPRETHKRGPIAIEGRKCGIESDVLLTEHEPLHVRETGGRIAGAGIRQQGMGHGRSSAVPIQLIRPLQIGKWGQPL